MYWLKSQRKKSAGFASTRTSRLKPKCLFISFITIERYVRMKSLHFLSYQFVQSSGKRDNQVLTDAVILNDVPFKCNLKIYTHS